MSDVPEDLRAILSNSAGREALQPMTPEQLILEQLLEALKAFRYQEMSAKLAEGRAQAEHYLKAQSARGVVRGLTIAYVVVKFPEKAGDDEFMLRIEAHLLAK